MNTTPFPYVGSGPYCYANSMAMMLGTDAPPPGVIEVLTGSPFGVQIEDGRLPFFDPLGWDPDLGIDAALALLGWTCERSGGAEADAEEALARLRTAVATGPALVGPVEMGLLRHQPGMDSAIRADHWVVVTDVDRDFVTMHDPHGYPYARLPVAEFLDSWRAELILWGGRYVLRTGLVKERDVDPLDALRASLPAAIDWLAGRDGGARDSIGGVGAVEQIAELVENGLEPEWHGHLVYFAVQVGARRLSDAATCLGMIDMPDAAAIADRQARLVGSLQYDLVRGDNASAAATLRELAPTYEQLRAALAG